MDITTECFGCCWIVKAKRAYILILIFDGLALVSCLAGGIFTIVAEILQLDFVYTGYYIYDNVIWALGLSITSLSGLLILILIPTLHYASHGFYRKVLQIYQITRTIFYSFTLIVGISGFIWIFLIKFLTALQTAIILWLQDETLIDLFVQNFLPFVVTFSVAAGLSVPSLIWSSVLKKTNVFFKAGLFEPTLDKNRNNDFAIQPSTHLPQNIIRGALSKIFPEEQLITKNPEFVSSAFVSPKVSVPSLVLDDAKGKKKIFHKFENKDEEGESENH